ncbi:hypothetical protein DERP_005277 [Dermatophagoides pteronyssinus]|uniref:Protein kinase domain-containing protein n=1 Tax=Dermatophagoides pteronyssinus TaxID=6956 RepID=A0ABQ8JM67_DERPT|nr:hypothetical protein DERP_005277 [Dermatophagoides pteronyssinus]
MSSRKSSSTSQSNYSSTSSHHGSSNSSQSKSVMSEAASSASHSSQASAHGTSSAVSSSGSKAKSMTSSSSHVSGSRTGSSMKASGGSASKGTSQVTLSSLKASVGASPMATSAATKSQSKMGSSYHSSTKSGTSSSASKSGSHYSSVKPSSSNASSYHSSYHSSNHSSYHSSNVNGSRASSASNVSNSHSSYASGSKASSSASHTSSYHSSYASSNAANPASKAMVSNKPLSLALANSIEPSSIPGRPKLCDKMNEIDQCQPYVELNDVNELQSNGGFSLGNFIVEDDCYKYYSAGKDGHEIICKIINLDKCTPRYRENMLRFSLKITRFVGGSNGSPPISEYFVDVLEIFKIGPLIYVFMENCPNKSLYLVLLDHDKYSAIDERRWTVQIVKGIAKLQEYGIAHRFIKLQHILFDSKHNVKIAGFSKSVLFWDPNSECPLLQNCERKSRKNCHLPPESFRGPYDPSKVDMWSLGVLMVCLQTRSYPFNVNSTSKFSAQWRQFVLKHEMNRYVRAAINQTFSIDPKRRVKPADFLKHPYFTASVSNIEPKVLKTTVDPKYDPNMIDESSCHVSTTGTVSAISGSSVASSYSGTTSKNSHNSKPSSVCSGSSKSSSTASASVASSGSTSAGSMSATPTLAAPTLAAPISAAPTSAAPTSAAPTSAAPTSAKGSTSAASSVVSTSASSTSAAASSATATSMNDDEFGDDNASGIEGGKVGQEIPAEEMAHESHAQENSAPEEQADQAKPISYNSSQNNESLESKKT